MEKLIILLLASLVLISGCDLFEDSQPDYVCPEQDTINCMPIVPEDRIKYCSGDYHEWIEENCETEFLW